MTTSNILMHFMHTPKNGLYIGVASTIDKPCHYYSKEGDL